MQIGFLSLLLSLWTLFSLSASNPAFYLTVSFSVSSAAFACALLCISLLCTGLYFVFCHFCVFSISVVTETLWRVTYFFLFFILSGIIVPLCHCHRYHKSFFTFLATFLLTNFCTLTVEAGRNVHGLLLYLSLFFPIAWYPLFYFFTKGDATIESDVSWSNFPFVVPSFIPSCNAGLQPKADLCRERSWEDTGGGQGNQKAELTLTFQTWGKLRPGWEHSASPGCKWEEGKIIFPLPLQYDSLIWHWNPHAFFLLILDLNQFCMQISHNKCSCEIHWNATWHNNS